MVAGSSTGMLLMPPYRVLGVPGMYAGGFPAVYRGLPGMSLFAGYSVTDKVQKAKGQKKIAKEEKAAKKAKAAKKQKMKLTKEGLDDAAPVLKEKLRKKEEK